MAGNTREMESPVVDQHIPPLSYARRSQLAAIVLGLYILLLLLKGGILAWVAWQNQDQQTAITVALSHLLIGGISGFFAWMVWPAQAPKNSRPLPRILALGAASVIWALLQIPNVEYFHFGGSQLWLLSIGQVLLGLLLVLALGLVWKNAGNAGNEGNAGKEGKEGNAGNEGNAKNENTKVAAKPRLSWLSTSAVQILVLGYVLTLTEIGLRQVLPIDHPWMAGNGQAARDKLRLEPGFQNDSLGIYCLAPEFVAEINQSLQQSLNQGTALPLSTDCAAQIKQLMRDYQSLQQGGGNPRYQQWLQGLAAQDAAQRDPIDQAYREQLSQPINAQGFRSIPFQAYATHKKKILLLGDSFTWGYSATSFSYCFAESLQMAGYAVFNSGISATDPAQYEAVAKAYLPEIAPDIVLLNLYLGNDLFNFERPIRQDRPLNYATNAGVLNAYPGPEWLPDAATAFEFWQHERGILGKDGSAFYRFCTKTVLGSLLWAVINKIGLIPFERPNAQYWQRCAENYTATPGTLTQLRRIADFCKAHQTPLLIAVIPRNPAEIPSAAIWQKVLQRDAEIIVPADIEAHDYTVQDGHFNNRGHAKYAAFLLAALAARGF